MITVGQRLSSERLSKKLTIEEVAKATKIRSKFIQALEKGEYTKLPSSAYIQGFIKNYAEYLGLPKKEILAMFRREFDEREFLRVLPDSFSSKPFTFSGFRLRTTTVFIIGGIIFVGLFLLFEYRAAFINPYLTIISPPENAVINSQTITIRGKTDANNSVTINDSPVYIDKNGYFSKDIEVFTGAHTIVIKALNKFGKNSQLLRHIYIK